MMRSDQSWLKWVSKQNVSHETLGVESG